MKSKPAAPAGYSGKPLSEKLGIKPGFSIYAPGAPDHYGTLLEPVPPGVTISAKPGKPVDIVHLFAGTEAALKKSLPGSVKSVKEGGMLWISWPKKASGVATDLDENLVRDIVLKTEFVDVKVCAINLTWSGLKFLRRKK